jgi:AcrR family transcriptional regulator
MQTGRTGKAAKLKVGGRSRARPDAATPRRRPRRGAARAGDRNRTAQIMEVALDLFSAKDYAAVTVTQIAETIGVRHSLIYYYFDSKEDLFHKTVESHIARTMADYAALVKESGHPVELIENWFDINVRLSTPLRKLVKIMFAYSGSQAHPRSLADAIGEFYRTERRIIATGIAKGVDLGVFRPVDAGRVASFVSTHIDGIFFSSLMREEIDLASAMAELKRNLWLILGYDAETGKRVAPRDEFD